MDYPATLPSRYLTTIDIILSVIDNYGDIGFACELIALWKRQLDCTATFVIWTDNLFLVTSFVEKNRHFLGAVEIRDRADFGKDRLSLLTLALFHTDIPDISYFDKSSLVLRIDYLSFDPTWIVHHLDEHITSTQSRRIVEIIPSPLYDGGGLIPYYDTDISRDYLAHRYGLDAKKEWIIVFVYRETLDSIIHFDHLSSQQQILLFGDLGYSDRDGIVCIPWVDIPTWYAFIDASIWAVVRGEVSVVASIMRGKLGFWDMYKTIGGFYPEQSEDFLQYISADEVYRDIHVRLNRQKIGPVYWSEIQNYMDQSHISHPNNTKRIHNLITEIKKCIDSHEFSI